MSSVTVSLCAFLQRHYYGDRVKSVRWFEDAQGVATVSSLLAVLIKKATGRSVGLLCRTAQSKGRMPTTLTADRKQFGPSVSSMDTGMATAAGKTGVMDSGLRLRSIRHAIRVP